MARIRTDNCFGTITDNPLTNVATTMNSAGLANLAAVTAPDEAIIILDPNRLTGAPEIVVVTAHTGSATSATIVRGQFGTTARQHALGTEWVHGPIASNATSFVTVANDQGDFPPLGAWEAYTPSNVNITVGNGTQVARFMRVGRTIHFMYELVWGSTTSFGGTIDIGLPVAASSALSVTAMFAGYAADASAAANSRVLSGFITSAGAATVRPRGDGAHVINATTPFTWTTDDVLQFGGTYEAAS